VSKLSQLRKKWNYETDVPRCCNCVHFKNPVVYVVRDSLPRRSHPLCKAGDFTVRPNAVCDKWTGIDGSTVAPGASL
jgi:hypothetical protein